jgi:hypothetical protein
MVRGLKRGWVGGAVGRLLLGLVVLSLGSVSPALAAGAKTSGTITGCFNLKTGALRISSTCGAPSGS